MEILLLHHHYLLLPATSSAQPVSYGLTGNVKAVAVLLKYWLIQCLLAAAGWFAVPKRSAVQLW
jgi:hypothetical protein